MQVGVAKRRLRANQILRVGGGGGGSKDSLCVLLVISFTSDFVNKMPALTHSLYFVKLLALGGHSMLEEDYFEY